MQKKRCKTVLSFCLASALIGSSFSPVLAEKDVPDKHWAATNISKWINAGYIAGYQDGSFKPDKQVTRAEFVRLVNMAFDFSGKENLNYRDVSPSQWFYDEFAIAKAAGYITGYKDGTVKPDNKISREEAALIVAKALKLIDAPEQAEKFKDSKVIGSWSKGAIGAAVAAGIINGYQDGTFKPQKMITRAETVVMLDNALAGKKSEEDKRNIKSFDKAGVYGSEKGIETVEGDVTITAKDVTLQNMVIKGNVTLAEGIGEGDVIFKNITVEGNTIIKGGGENSIKVFDSNLSTVTVNKGNGKVRVLVSGKTSVENVTLQSGAKLEESELKDATGFEDVTLVNTIVAGSEVKLTGSFKNVLVENKQSLLELSNGVYTNITLATSAEDSKVDINLGATVKTLVVNAKAKIFGSGKIELAKVNVSDATLELTPEKTENNVLSSSIGSSSSSNGNTTKTAQASLTNGIGLTIRSNVRATISEREITELGNVPTEITQTIIGKPIEITSASQPKSATLSFVINPNQLPSGVTEPVLAFFNPVHGEFEKVLDQKWDGNKLTATLKHFSTYVLMDSKLFAQAWKSNLEKGIFSGGGQSTTRDSVNVAFAIDSSGSMMGNDPQNERIVGAKAVVDVLLDKDKAAVIDFDQSVEVLQDLTSDKANLKTAIEQIDSSGGTNIASGIAAALNVLGGSPSPDTITAVTSADTVDLTYAIPIDDFFTSGDTVNYIFIDQSPAQLTSSDTILLLTDGQDGITSNFVDMLTNVAKARSIRIDVMGLGSGINEELLKEIASKTSGSYYYVASASALESRFVEAIGGAVGGDIDTDKDGIPDWVELRGYYLKDTIASVDANGVPVLKYIQPTDPNKADTDGDGLSDAVELGDVYKDKDTGEIYVSPEIFINGDSNKANKPYVSNPHDPLNL